MRTHILALMFMFTGSSPCSTLGPTWIWNHELYTDFPSMATLKSIVLWRQAWLALTPSFLQGPEWGAGLSQGVGPDEVWGGEGGPVKSEAQREGKPLPAEKKCQLFSLLCAPNEQVEKDCLFRRLKRKENNWRTTGTTPLADVCAPLFGKGLWHVGPTCRFSKKQEIILSWNFRTRIESKSPPKRKRNCSLHRNESDHCWTSLHKQNLR